MKHAHRFVATPITGRGMHDGRERLFDLRIECEQCGKKPQSGDIVEEIKSSWWKEVVSETKLVRIVCP